MPFRYTLLLSFAIFVLLTVQGLWIIEKGIRPTLIDIAQMETKKIATSALNTAVREMIQHVNTDELINMKYNENGEISSVGFDTMVYNKVVSEAVHNVEVFMELMERGEVDKLNIEKKESTDASSMIGVIYMIPLGQAMNNSLLAQVGPKVPVKFTAVGDVAVALNEQIQPVGINNAYIRIAMDLEIHMQIVIPFATKTTRVSTTVPVGMVYVPGKVPQFFGGNSGGSPFPGVIIEEVDEF
ncbi:sporulation protein YunB [bacterium LRH843]|nr:sporulation protein YunB [bacterium LRH843]